MKRHRVLTVLILVVSAVLLGSCSGSSSSNNNSNTSVNANSENNNSSASLQLQNDNVEDLRSMVRMPFEPEEVAWRLSDAADKGRRISAVILLSAVDHKAIESRLKSSGSSRAVRVNVEEWFPNELVAMGDTSGESAVTGVAYPGTEFFQEPFLVGDAVLIPETLYLILEITER